MDWCSQELAVIVCLNKATVVSINSSLERAPIDYRWVYYLNVNTKKLLAIHRVIFREAEPENDAYEIVSKVQKGFEIKFSKQTNSKLREISFGSVKLSIKEFNRLIGDFLQSRLGLCISVIWDTQVLYR